MSRPRRPTAKELVRRAADQLPGNRRAMYGGQCIQCGHFYAQGDMIRKAPAMDGWAHTQCALDRNHVLIQ